MSQIRRLLRENVLLLEGGRALIAALGDELYAAPAPALALSGAGSHLRHCLDFYAAFLSGLPAGLIDYDGRERDPRLESDAAHAAQRIGELIAALMELERARVPERELRVKPEASGPMEPPACARSSLARELQFLSSHTVHHYALIAVVARHHGHEPGPEFGVAPSTLRYWQEREADACAP